MPACSATTRPALTRTESRCWEVVPRLRISPSLDGRPGHATPPALMLLLLLLWLGRRQAVAALVSAGRPGRLLLLLLLTGP